MDDGGHRVRYAEVRMTLCNAVGLSVWCAYDPYQEGGRDREEVGREAYLSYSRQSLRRYLPISGSILRSQCSCLFSSYHVASSRSLLLVSALMKEPLRLTVSGAMLTVGCSARVRMRGAKRKGSFSGLTVARNPTRLNPGSAPATSPSGASGSLREARRRRGEF